MKRHLRDESPPPELLRPDLLLNGMYLLSPIHRQPSSGSEAKSGMAKSVDAFGSSPSKLLSLPESISILPYLPVMFPSEWSTPPHPPEPPDPPDPPDRSRFSRQSLSSLVFILVSCYCGKGLMFGRILRGTDFSSPSLGLVSPDRKDSPEFLEAHLPSTTTKSTASPTLPVPQVYSTSSTVSPSSGIYQFREAYVALVLWNTVLDRVSQMVSVTGEPSRGSFTALVRFFAAICISFSISTESPSKDCLEDRDTCEDWFKDHEVCIHLTLVEDLGSHRCPSAGFLLDQFVPPYGSHIVWVRFIIAVCRLFAGISRVFSSPSWQSEGPKYEDIISQVIWVLWFSFGSELTICLMVFRLADLLQSSSDCRSVTSAVVANSLATRKLIISPIFPLSLSGVVAHDSFGYRSFIGSLVKCNSQSIFILVVVTMYLGFVWVWITIETQP